MSTLLLRFAAPLQAWGGESKYDIRKTEREPTKSGVIGLIASALGRRRDEPLDDLTALRFGVRVDREGEMLRDFHMVHGEGRNPQSYLTTRHYLADAVFLAALEGDAALLEQIAQALSRPAYPLFLGRRSCPPEGRVCLGIREKRLLDALRSESWLLPLWRQEKEKNTRLRIVLDAPDATAAPARRRDLPLSFNSAHRQYGYRALIQARQTVDARALSPFGNQTEHDPLDGWEEDAYVSVADRS